VRLAGFFYTGAIMRKFIIAAALALTATAAFAACYTHTFIGQDGRMVVCTTCCSGNNCTTTCI
jgi:hypothetical protein